MDNEEVLSLAWNTHQAVLMSVFESLLQTETLVDCTLAAEGQRVKAHKIIISACSPYLKMLLSEQSENHPIIILNETSFDDLKSMLEYMYRGEVNIKKKDLARFVRSAEALQIRGLASHSILSQRTSSSESDESQTNLSRKKTNSVVETSPHALNEAATQSCGADTDYDVLLVPKNEVLSDEEQLDNTEGNEDEEVETAEQPIIESSDNIEPIIEDETVQNWEPEAGGSTEGNILQETVYTENSEGNCDPVNKEKANSEQGSSVSNFSVKVTKLPVNYSWFDEDFSSVDKENADIEICSPTDCEKVKPGTGTAMKDKVIMFSQKQAQMDAVRVFKCNLCPAVYNRLSSLTSHKSRHHPNHSKPGTSKHRESLLCNPNQIARFCCPFCPGKFHKLSSLKQHITVAHLIDKTTKSSPEKKKLQCPVCKFSFIEKDALALHMRYCHAAKDANDQIKKA